MSFWCFFGFCLHIFKGVQCEQSGYEKKRYKVAAVLLLIMGSAFAKVRKLETVQTDGSVSVVRPRVH